MKETKNDLLKGTLDLLVLQSLSLGPQRWTYLGSAMTHPQFLRTVGEISPNARTQIEEMSKAFC